MKPTFAARWRKRIAVEQLVQRAAGIALVLILLAASAGNGQTTEPDPSSSDQCVLLLHGLARTSSSMSKMAIALEDDGYRVVNIDYPSRKQPVATLAETHIPPALAQCRSQGAKRIHFVTHSMGGILVRYYLKMHHLPDLGRVVMLSPPNAGSEVVDHLRQNVLFRWLNGPAGQELGTGADDLPTRLGPVNFELGVITGDRSINLILSMMIPGPDDGKVAVRRARISGMADFSVVHATHPFIMQNKVAIEQTIAFLKSGRFSLER